MIVTSPYGKPVSYELRTVYGLDGPDAARDFILHHVVRNYTVHEPTVESIEVAFGLSAKIRAQGECFYLKFTSRRIHGSPEQLFPWLAYALDRGVPVPQILPSVGEDWFMSPLCDSCYDVVYLMREIPGTPMPAPGENELAQYAEVMALFHEVGSAYPDQVKGRSATWNSKLKNRNRLFQQATDESALSSSLLTQAKECVEGAETRDLSTTIVHGDLRFCHVLFDDGTLTGLIDIDTSASGERWVDYCAGLISGNSPESGNLLNLDQLRRTLTCYHQRLPLNAADQSALKATFGYAAVEFLYDLSQSAAAGTTDKDDIESAQELLSDILRTPDLLS